MGEEERREERGERREKREERRREMRDERREEERGERRSEVREIKIIDTGRIQLQNAVDYYRTVIIKTMLTTTISFCIKESEIINCIL